MQRLHIVGCPRSGTTLLMEQLSACFSYDHVCDHEVSIFDPLPEGDGVYFSKKPTDILHIQKVFPADDDLYILYIVRDPRSVITSKHHSNRDIFFCNYKIWKKCEDAASNFENHPRFLSIRYEDLVHDSDHCQDLIENQFSFLQRKHKFSDYHKVAAPPEDALKAMEGLRPVNTASLEKWHQQLPRIKQQLESNPQFQDDLVRRGYENDSKWQERLLEKVSAEEYPCRYPETDNPLKEWEKQLRMWWRSRRYLKARKL